MNWEGIVNLLGGDCEWTGGTMNELGGESKGSSRGC